MGEMIERRERKTTLTCVRKNSKEKMVDAQEKYCQWKCKNQHGLNIVIYLILFL